MKKITYKVLSALLSTVTLVSAACFNVNAETNIQPRGSWYLYGDVDNSGNIEIADAEYVMQAYTRYENLTGDSKLPLSYAVARPSVYFDLVNFAPQAADVNDDGYISQEDAQLIQNFLACLKDTGRCGQPFFIN